MTKEQAIELVKRAGAETSDGTHWEFDDFDPIKFATLVRNAALEQAKQIDWTEVMREGQLVTWGDASTLGYRVFEKLESLKEPTP